MRRAQDVLLFLVRFNNSARFEIYGVTRSSSSRPFLCALALPYSAHLVTSLRSFCVSRKGGTGDGGWGHPQGEMHMVAAKHGCQGTMVEDLPWLGPYVQILTLAVWTGIENATLPL